MRSAAAEVAGQLGFHLFERGVRVTLEQRRGGHDHAVGAVSALRRLFGDEGGLHPVKRLGRAQAFESSDAVAAACWTVMMQDRAAWPSIHTVQEPHWPSFQPNFAPRSPSVFRKT